MGTETIDGSVEAVWLKRRRTRIAHYEKILFRLADGRTRAVVNATVGAAVAERLLPGTSGRFYLYTAIDHRGVHGFRGGAGEAVFAFPTVNETAIAVIALLNAAWLAVAVSLEGRVPLLPLFLTLVSIPAWFLYRHTRIAARRQFDGDAAGLAAAAHA